MHVIEISSYAHRHNAAFNSVINPDNLLLPAREHHQIAGNAVGGERQVIIGQERRFIAERKPYMHTLSLVACPLGYRHGGIVIRDDDIPVREIILRQLRSLGVDNGTVHLIFHSTFMGHKYDHFMLHGTQPVGQLGQHPLRASPGQRQYREYEPHCPLSFLSS
ncbi:hypothetical protein D3C75_908970 [compost metagenome]